MVVTPVLVLLLPLLGTIAPGLSAWADASAAATAPEPSTRAVSAPIAPADAPPANRRSLAEFLDPEGRLLPTASGTSLDPTGFRLTTSADGSPRFLAQPDGAAGGATAVPEGTWDDRFGRTGVDFGSVHAVAVSATDIYVGGAFGSAAAQQPTDSFRNVAHWDGRRWRPMGAGTNAPVNAMVVHGGIVYAAGQFTQAGGVGATGIARWNGASWSALGTGLTGTSTGGAGSGVGSALTVFDGRVVVGGMFWWAGGVVARSVAAWDGASWSALGAGACDAACGIAGEVRALSASSTTLFMGGSFERAGGATPVNSVAKWNGSAWSGLGSGVHSVLSKGRVDALAVDGSSVYVGGQFDVAGATPASSIARWNGSAWSALGTGLTKLGFPAYAVTSLALYGGSVYAGGDFDTAGGAAALYFARWNGATWASVPTGVLTDVVASLTATADGVIVTGPTRAGGLTLHRIGRWTGTEWRVYGQGIVLGGYEYNLGGFGDVQAVAVTSTGEMYVAGRFQQAGDVVTRSIAKWDGSRWSSLQGGVTDPGDIGGLDLGVVRAMVVDANDNLYVGGTFNQAGVVPAANIAKWNGSAWSTLGAGTSGDVHGLTLDGNTLFVGGEFFTAGSISTVSMARYDIVAGAWSKIHPTHQLGVGEVVRQFVVWNDWVFIGGTFATFGGQHMFSLLAWNRVNNQFTDMGMGVNFLGQPGHVLSLAVVGNHLYVAGRYGEAGFVGSPNRIVAPGLARLDLATELWSLVGNPTISGGGMGALALQAVGTDLYVGGDFSHAGGMPAPRIARFSTLTSTWSALGAGLVAHQQGEGAQAFAVHGRDLLVGGEFVTAGGQPAASFSVFGMPSTPPDPPRNVTASIVSPVQPLAGGAAAADVEVLVGWQAPISDGGSPILTYTATASPGGQTCSWSTGPLTCTVTGLARGVTYRFTVRATNAIGAGATSPASPPVRAAVQARFHALTPARILDTRPGPTQVGLVGAFGPTQSRVLQVTGSGGVPAGATAAVLNITSVFPSAFSHLSLTPDTLSPGQSPTTSNLNLTPGTVRPNLVVAPLSSLGRTTIYNNSGTVHVLADVVGWFDDGTIPGDRLTALPPARILDTRPGAEQVGLAGAFGPGQSRVLQVTGKGGVLIGATAVVLNVTSVNPTADSHISLTPATLAPGQSPTTSNLNLAAGQVRPNLVVVKLNLAGQVTIYNNSGNVHVLADVVGYFSANASSTVETLTPTRILDTRPGPEQVGLAGAFGPTQARVLQVTGNGGVPAGAAAVWMNVTSVNPTAESFLSLTPQTLSPGQVPATSNLNLAAGQVVPNLVLVKLSPGGQVTIYNNSGNVHVLADVVGYVN